MNNVNQNWKCPNCDTVNTGRRCVICGAEKPEDSKVQPELKSTMHNGVEAVPKKSNKGLIVSLLAVIGILLIAVIAICVLSFGRTEKKETEKKPSVSHEAVTAEDDEEEKKPVKKDEYINDPVYGVKFNLSVDKHGMEKKPEYTEKISDSIVYIVPKNFKNTDGNRYFAYDETAYIKYTANDISGTESVSDILTSKKKALGGNAAYEASGENWYVLSTLRNDVIYYTKGVIDNGYEVSFIFVYPAEYSDIYNDYVDEIADGLKLPDRSGVEVIEDESQGLEGTV